MKTKRNAWLPDFGLKGWGIVILAFAFYYIGQGVFDSGLNTVLAIYNKAYGWSNTFIASIVTLGGWLSIIAMAVFGAICKKKGAKYVSIMGMLGVALFFGVLGVSKSLPGFVVGVLGYLFCAAAFQTIGVGQFGANWFPKKTGLYMGIATMGLTAAAATINPIMGSVMGSKGIPFFMYSAAVICVVVAVIMLLFVKNYPEEAGAYPDNDKSISREELEKEAQVLEEHRKNNKVPLKKILTSKSTWQIGIGWSIPMMAAVGIVGQLGFALMDYGHDFMFGIMLLSTVWPLGIIGSYLCGVIDDKYGTKPASLIVVALELIGTLIIILFGTSKIASAIGVGVLLFAISGVTNTTVSMSTTVFGRKNFENYYPVVAVMYKVIVSAGVTIMALIAAKVSYKWAFGAIIIICIIYLAIMATTSDKCISDNNDQLS